MASTKVVILGGGFAGINAAKSLGNSQFDVWLIDRTNHHLFQPLLYQVASAALSPGDIAVPIREIVSPYENITVIMGEVVEIDKKKQEVRLHNGDLIGYEYLIIALGARHSYFGKNEWEPFAPGLKTLDDALKIHERILMSFEKAERCDSISEARKYLNFVIIGGGPTGVEMAGAISEIAYQTMLRDFRRIDTTKTKIHLIEGSEHILPVYPERLSNKARHYLENFGVNVITGKRVSQITAEGVTVENLFIPAENVLWAAGNQASSVLKTLGVPLDRQGRVLVDRDLTIPEHPEVFVLGDAACAMDKKGNPLPGLAPVAVQQGRYVAQMLRRRLPHSERPPFVYFDKGTMATIGKSKAIGTFGKVQFSGFIAWLGWSFIHILYLIGFRNRLVVLMQWLFSYFASHRGARVIIKSIHENIPNIHK
ncbi:MAG: pyridine nucleotide-disulfide oxidoreductase [Chlamydiae bacterium RIFCSPHIGHO2_12_FULL_44_59]|nr:MAG: pyridine nucleotide-disulfide oxidoreductase [Chlamydiae bacterium RIFCSPHIGHO2_01_FULL_44_39]OGN57354.1 MAG: pyridine nucleotide-disulfide oxidoreductase [Chlamydiae bacterium RIFCSPHIGHO2_02_FULL_45_9]OGN59698.1 MAG: pyridine nucleotide-disulfide oxidoreductase [Chlamydiae bacterium RIFCSPHIGHO2_12_FULL_44_59]OGN65775.1 MAG: pyridine nucleotide-disulfide oxidoreductase [Chlamydiae bacterium RIFCSPLOWO2_01_FULL_44_52]OGN67937.1 MAG: pyridine nucleotide-disulfide oxidoreductase [Chlamyd